jgi:hypothetical protein
MHKNATKCNETIGKWCKNKHGASKIIDTFETYHWGGHTTPWPGLARATRWCGSLLAPLCLVLWLRGSSGKIRFLQYFLGFFLKVGFLHKNKTSGQFY